jgi:hypothetical protein
MNLLLSLFTACALADDEWVRVVRVPTARPKKKVLSHASGWGSSTLAFIALDTVAVVAYGVDAAVQNKTLNFKSDNNAATLSVNEELLKKLNSARLIEAITAPVATKKGKIIWGVIGGICLLGTVVSNIGLYMASWSSGSKFLRTSAWTAASMFGISLIFDGVIVGLYFKSKDFFAYISKELTKILEMTDRKKEGCHAIFFFTWLFKIENPKPEECINDLIPNPPYAFKGEGGVEEKITGTIWGIVICGALSILFVLISSLVSLFCVAFPALCIKVKKNSKRALLRK